MRWIWGVCWRVESKDWDMDTENVREIESGKKTERLEKESIVGGGESGSLQ